MLSFAVKLYNFLIIFIQISFPTIVQHLQIIVLQINNNISISNQKVFHPQ